MIAIAIVFLVLMVLFFLLLKNKKNVILDIQKLNNGQKHFLTEHVAYYRKLSKREKSRFEAMIQSFLKSVRIEGVGTIIEDSDRLLIASSAVIPIFGFAGWQYKNLTNVILYPDTFNNDFQFEGESRNIMGMVGSGYMNGQMLLSRAALVKGFSNSPGKENTGIHEFVHLLDSSDGATDGIPEYLMDHQYALPWLNMIHQEMSRIEKGKSDINPYALTNEAEFLAVVSEYFFQKPLQLQQKYPDLYKLLSQIFIQNPAAS